ncbi:LRRN4 protein, partial [Formicarius rufipectus]|nr:LRRN4 protein [Formicarius rufipectus]
RRRMFSGLFILSLLVRSIASGPVSRAEPAASRDVTTFFQLAQEDTWEHVNLTSMSCEARKNRTWITLQLTNSSLTAFPVCLPEALETLDLSNNLLAEVNGSEIAPLPRLRVLSLRQNHLWSLTWGSEPLSSLLKLDLSFNQLSSVPSCHNSALPNLRWLSLAGNPLMEIQPLAFSCSPQLQVLNLSVTLLGQDDGRGIRESAFAISTAPREATDRPGSSINVLDLSRTFLEKIQPEWTRDLSNLRSLHLTKMPQLRSLDTDFVQSMPALRELHCQDSHALGFVRTEMFVSAPHLSHLSFQNCNLSSFNPWDTNSSDGITINLYGNPLLCDCQLSWLLSKPKKVVLQKARETFCTSQEDGGRPSTSVSLLELYDECQSEGNVTLPNSNTPSPHHDAFSFTIAQSTSNPSSFASITSFPVFLKEFFAQSSDFGSTSQTQTEQPKGELGTTEAPFPQEGPFTQTTSHYPAGATGIPNTTDHSVHSFASHAGEGTQQGTPQPASSRSSAQPEPAPTRPPSHYIDYYDYEEQPKETPVQPGHVSCDYNPCRHLQKPCSELQSVSQCSCPGMSTEDEVPDPPRLREVTEVTDSSALIRWCAPYSVVHTYELMVHAQGKEDRQLVLDNIYPTSRQYTLYNLSPYTTYNICVTASNKAGSSQITGQGIPGSSQITGQEIPGSSCTRFKTKPSYKFVFAALSAASGLFLITTIVLSVCLCKACKKPHSEQYGTHLVSYKNPA